MTEPSVEAMRAKCEAIARLHQTYALNDFPPAFNGAYRGAAQNIADAIAALAAEPASEPNADWSKLPRDMYVVSVTQRDAVVYDAKMCSVPMAIGPEVRYSRAALAAEPASGEAVKGPNAPKKVPQYLKLRGDI
jgi:hypothetical protein